VIHKRIIVIFLVGMIGSASTHASRSAQQQSAQSHIAWVAEALMRMQTIKPGMTRSDLLKVFTTEGGLSTRLQRTFVSRDCLYFKVDVKFEAVGRPNRDVDGRVTLIEDGRDVIVKISRPYLAFAVSD
jgi:Tfp pilus assembly protein PilV